MNTNANTTATGHHPLHPPLPFDMKPRAQRAAGDIELQQFIHQATQRKDQGRVEVMASAFGRNVRSVRELAGRIKQHTLDHLDVYLERFIDQAQRSGAKVYFAGDAEQANAICLAVAQANGCKLCVKSKSMVTEETKLVPALEQAGIETIETDLGEFIIQLDNDAPSHIVTPMIHKNRVSVARAFQRELGTRYTEDPQELTMIARRHMRDQYRRADLGISGGNFLTADTGSIVLCTNEGNADLAISTPRVHIALVGIEKLIPRLNHLSVFLKVLARSSTAQPLTVYTTLITGPKRQAEHDGPRELHIILLDNGRSGVLREPTRELLRCIRCGACLNTCPVFRKVGGGHAYGAVYSGPIGAILTPRLKGLENYPDPPQASSLCGACHEACPVDIDIPLQLIRLRAEAVDRRMLPWSKRWGYRLWATGLKHPSRYRLICVLQRIVLRAMGQASPTRDQYDDRRWIDRLAGPTGGWTDHRDFPSPTGKSFRDWWREQEKRA